MSIVHAAHSANRICESPDYVAKLKSLDLWPTRWRRIEAVTCPECLAIMGVES